MRWVWNSSGPETGRRRPAAAPLLLVALVAATAGGAAQSADGPAHVVLVTLDGARWQEVFGGLDLEVLRATSGKTPPEQTEAHKRFWAATAAARREKLMPFLWTTLARQHGFVAGDRSLGSRVAVTNRHRFSYPGYNELLTGAAHDDVVTSNDNKRYDFLTVLEWLRPALGLPVHGVAAFGSWETFNWIAERQEGSVFVNAGYEAYVADDPAVTQLSALQFETVTPWPTVRHDAYTHRFAMAHLARHRPRVLYVAYGETDDWAHEGRYDRTLEALHRTDGHLRELWSWLQSDPAYRGRTTMIVTVDHGRGRTPKDWTSHGADVAGAEEIWLACAGPRVTERGALRDHVPVEQRQVAATVAAAVGEDFREAVTAAAPPIAACAGR